MSQAAGGSMRRNRSAQAAMASQSARTPARAAPGAWRRKKIQDQRRLSASCTAKTAKAAVRSDDGGATRMRQAAMAMRTYSVVQTGPKTHEGGLNDGLRRVRYQVGISGAVQRAPARPTAWQRRIRRTRRKACMM